MSAGAPPSSVVANSLQAHKWNSTLLGRARQLQARVRRRVHLVLETPVSRCCGKTTSRLRSADPLANDMPDSVICSIKHSAGRRDPNEATTTQLCLHAE